MRILGVKCNDLSIKKAAEVILAKVKSDFKISIFFLNIDCLYKACNDKEYLKILNKASLVLPDGIGLKIVAGIFGLKIKENSDGTDFSPYFIKEAVKKGYNSVFFLGSRGVITKKAALEAKRIFKGLRVAGTHSGYFKNDAKVIKKINNSGADIVFVGMGAPLQEKWISKNRALLKPKICLGVGALFDFLSKNFKRAPKFVRRLRLEWLWRVFLEPRRLAKRYFLYDAGFLYFCLKRRFKEKMKKLSVRNYLKKLTKSNSEKANKFRKKRFSLFLKLIKDASFDKKTKLRILDAGGGIYFWEQMDFLKMSNLELTILNLTKEKSAYFNVKSVIGDACRMSQYPDKSFDIVFSNSVIEHLGAFDKQKEMSGEVKRIGKNFFLQTPNYWFPFEPHFLILGFQFLPLRMKAFLLRHFNLGWFSKIKDYKESIRTAQSIRLLKEKELKELFEGASIVKEKFFGLTKSFIVYNFQNPA